MNRLPLTLTSALFGFVSLAWIIAPSVSLAKTSANAEGRGQETVSDPRPFNQGTDLFIAQFDNYPDSDDVHSQAAVGSFLSHADFEGMNTLAVAGAYGRQPGNAKWKYINSNELFELAFGEENVRWVDAHADRAFAANVIRDKAKPVLEAGGKVWVMEAGQSDVTADWLAALIADGVANTQTNVIVVQHSIWNIKQTTASDLDYVKEHAHYVKIEDGNHAGNGTPDYQESSTEYMASIFDASNPNTFAQSLWLKAKEITDACSYKGGPIPGGGIDFSDTAEAMWIFALDEKLPIVQTFLDAFVLNTPTR